MKLHVGVQTIRITVFFNNTFYIISADSKNV